MDLDVVNPFIPEAAPIDESNHLALDRVKSILVSLSGFSLSGLKLRTVPTIVIAHTFCASRDTRISYRRCLLIQGYFCAV